jgi:hypothetical protein
MNYPTRYESIQEPLDDEECELMDPDTWDWDSTTEGRTVGAPGAVLPIRFTREEYSALWRHAHAQGLSTHEFIKRLALEAVHATRT